MQLRKSKTRKANGGYSRNGTLGAVEYSALYWNWRNAVLRRDDRGTAEAARAHSARFASRRYPEQQAA